MTRDKFLETYTKTEGVKTLDCGSNGLYGLELKKDYYSMSDGKLNSWDRFVTPSQERMKETIENIVHVKETTIKVKHGGKK